MERLIAVTKLTLISALVVVAILALSYSNAYGLPNYYFSFTESGTPSVQPASSQGQAAMGSSSEFAEEIFWEDYDGGGNDPGACPPIPEPATLILLGVGLVGIRFLRRRS